jgi:L-amino acid N-acyltransferase YncA
MSTNPPLKIRPMLPPDWSSVRTIYQEGIDTGNATFEKEAPDWEHWDSAHLRDGRLVAERGETVVGWAALAPVSGRCVYSGVAEVSVYVAASARGQGVGEALLGSLVKESEARGFWTLQTGIFPENKASLALHQKCGFRIIGQRKRLGKMGDRWRDVMLLERRSTVVGM